MLHLRKMLRSAKFQMVYDLQTSERSSRYFHLGPCRGRRGRASRRAARIQHANPDRNLMHTLDRQADQLRMAGIPETPMPDLSWGRAGPASIPPAAEIRADGAREGPAHRLAKRWPAQRYAALARRFGELGISSVPDRYRADDHEPIDAVLAACPTAMSLADHTELLDIPAIARQAWAAIGNDTGPDASGRRRRRLPLRGAVSRKNPRPALCAPRGRVVILRKPDLAQLEVGEVWEALAALTA